MPPCAGGEGAWRITEAARERAGLTQSALAQRVGLAPNHIARIESAEKSHPRFETVAKIATELGVSLDELATVCGYGGVRRVSPSTAASTVAVIQELRGLLKTLGIAQQKVDAAAHRLSKEVGLPESIRAARRRRT